MTDIDTSPEAAEYTAQTILDELSGADRVVIETKNAIGLMDASYTTAAKVKGVLQAIMAERDQAIAREKALKDNTQHCRELQLELNALQAQLAEARNAALEEAAEIGDEFQERIGEEIRALKSAPAPRQSVKEAAKVIEHACAVIDAFSEYDQNECCDGRECGCRGSSVHEHMKHQIRALAQKEHGDG